MKIYKKKLPERTCVACRQVKPKKELTRLVTTPGGVVVDVTGKRPGRGAYLCNSVRCWEDGIKGKGIEHALKVSLSEDNLDALRRFATRLVPEERTL
jgi:predicted RNA-binding protein YlxR (DUF448 family)